jgi:hypothetical protein
LGKRMCPGPSRFPELPVAPSSTCLSSSLVHMMLPRRPFISTRSSDQIPPGPAGMISSRLGHGSVFSQSACMQLLPSPDHSSIALCGSFTSEVATAQSHTSWPLAWYSECARRKCRLVCDSKGSSGLRCCCTEIARPHCCHLARVHVRLDYLCIQLKPLMWARAQRRAPIRLILHFTSGRGCQVAYDSTVVC